MYEGSSSAYLVVSDPTTFLLEAPADLIQLREHVETVYPVSDNIPLSAHWSMAPCVNIRHIDVVVEGLGNPGTLAQEIITSAPVAKLRSVSLTFESDVKAELESRVHFEGREALESYLCYVADEKLKKDTPEEFTVTLFFTEKGGSDVQLGRFLDGLQKRGVLEVKVP